MEGVGILGRSWIWELSRYRNSVLALAAWDIWIEYTLGFCFVSLVKIRKNCLVSSKMVMGKPSNAFK